VLSLVLSGVGRQRWWHLRGQLAGTRIDHCTLQATREAAVQWVREHQPELIAKAGIDAATATFGQAVQLYLDLCGPSQEEQLHLDRLKGPLVAMRLADVDHGVLTRLANQLCERDGNEAKNRRVIGPAAAVLHFAARNGLCRFVRVEKFPIVADEPPAEGRWDEFR
jgi:hypothetical protein